MGSQPWIMQVGQVNMVTLCKIGAKYHCCWMCNKCSLHMGLTTWFCWSWQKDLKQEDIVSKLVCFSVDGVSAFQGFKSKVITSYVLFVSGVHCMVQQTNFAVQILSNLTLFLTLKIFYNVCMAILAIVPRSI